MKYIIMCGGEYVKWKKPRHLTKINGEPIVARTIRLLRENGVEDIYISSDDPVFRKFGVPILQHENDYTMRKYNDSDGHWVDGFYPVNEPVCYVFGDVIFSPEAIKTIVEYETGGIMFFGSKPPFAPEYPKTHVEPFAFKVVDTKRFQRACQKIKKMPESAFARKPIAWELWYVICGAPTKQDAENIVGADYVAINDYTCDIDDPREVRMVLKYV